MKITLMVQTGKGRRSTEKDIDKTVDVLRELDEFLYKKLMRYKSKAVAHFDGTSIIYTK